MSSSHGDTYCPNYFNQAVLPDEEGRCSLCGSAIATPPKPEPEPTVIYHENIQVQVTPTPEGVIVDVYNRENGELFDTNTYWNNDFEEEHGE